MSHKEEANDEQNDPHYSASSRLERMTTLITASMARTCLQRGAPGQERGPVALTNPETGEVLMLDEHVGDLRGRGLYRLRAFMPWGETAFEVLYQIPIEAWPMVGI